MPEDSGILKISPSNGHAPEPTNSGVTLEDLERIIHEWVVKILDKIDPPPEIWKRIAPVLNACHVLPQISGSSNRQCCL